jgi:hypothetical protein
MAKFSMARKDDYKFQWYIRIFSYFSGEIRRELKLRATRRLGHPEKLFLSYI